MTRRRTPKPPAPAEGAPVTTVTLNSQDSADFLRYRLQTTSGKAREAYEKGTVALEESARQGRIISQLDDAAETLRAQLAQIATERENAIRLADQAQKDGNSFMAEHEEFAKQAADARMFLDLAGEPVDVGLSAPNGHVTPPTAPMVELDPTADGHMQRFNAAHDEQAATEPEPKL